MPDLSRCNSRWLLELHSFQVSKCQLACQLIDSPLAPSTEHFINYLQNVNNFRNDIWKSILTTLQRSALYGADLVELNSLLLTFLQNIVDTRQTQVNLLTPTSFEVRAVRDLSMLTT